MDSDDTSNVNEALEPEELLTLLSHQHVLTDLQEKRCRVSAAGEEHTPVAKSFGLLCHAIVNP